MSGLRSRADRATKEHCPARRPSQHSAPLRRGTRSNQTPVSNDDRLSAQVLTGAVVDAVQFEVMGRTALRDLPWRRTRDPWAVLVAESMLQQTQVARVIPRWHEFLERFPDPSTCAAS